MEDDFTRLFWDRLCEINRSRRTNRPELRDFPIDGITRTPFDLDRGHLGIGGTEQPEAERRLRDFAGEGFVQIDGPIYRLSPRGEQFCATSIRGKPRSGR